MYIFIDDIPKPANAGLKDNKPNVFNALRFLSNLFCLLKYFIFPTALIPVWVFFVKTFWVNIYSATWII